VIIIDFVGEYKKFYLNFACLITFRIF